MVDFSENICNNDVFTTMRLLAEEDKNGKESEWVAAVGGISSV